jgi:hypothetical protein
MAVYQARFENIFRGICVICTISLTCWCIFEYTLNDDLVQIFYKEFHETQEDIYPSVTFCLRNPFLQDKLIKYDPNLTARFYEGLLSGGDYLCRQGRPLNKLHSGRQTILDNEYEWCKYEHGSWVKRNETWFDIDYDEVTYHLEDFLINVIIRLTNDRVRDEMLRYVMINNSLRLHDYLMTEEYRSLEKLDYYISARQPNYKCFSFDIPFVKGKPVQNVEITMNAAVFPNEMIEPINELYFVTLSYPNQIIRSLYRNKIFIRRQIPPTSCYIQDTIVGSMEVLTRRDKRSKRCNPDWRNHDKHVLQAIADKAGCIPKYWNIESDMNYCATNKQYHAIYNEYNHIRESVTPCRAMEKLTQTSFETDFGIKCTFTGNWRLMLNIDFHKETAYKEVVLVRAMSFQSLIGNSGKY